MSQVAANRTGRQPATSRRNTRPTAGVTGGQLRRRLLIYTAIGLVLLVLTGAQAVNAYSAVYQKFEGVALGDRIKIEDSDAALQAIAQVSRDAIDSIITAKTDKAKSSTANADVTIDFASFRQALFKVQGNLASHQEATAFNTADQSVYNDFWPHLTAMLAAQARGDSANVSVEFGLANTALEQTIIPQLTDLEQNNFAAMQIAQQAATGDITLELILLTVLAAAAALLLTIASFWLRGQIRRYLTLGLDLAVVLAWVCGILMFVDLIQTPNQMKQLVSGSYYGVSATQRILAIATQSYRTESAEILDLPHAQTWQALFDTNDALVEQAMCGYVGCIDRPFIWLDDANISAAVLKDATDKMPPDANAIVPVVPLITNVAYTGEPQALETMRQDYLDYITFDSQIRYEVALNLIPQAITLDTGFTGVGFNKFVQDVYREQQIKAAQFERVWGDVQNTLPVHEILIGIAGYALAFLCLCVGTYQRYREL